MKNTQKMTRRDKVQAGVAPKRQAKPEWIEKLGVNQIHLTATQKEFANKIKQNDLVFCVAPAGTGKAQPLDSTLITPNGYIRMKDVKVGDTIMGKDGWTKVTGVFPQGKKQVVRFYTKDGASVKACTEHLWFVHDSINKDTSLERIVDSTELMSLIDRKVTSRRNVSLPSHSAVPYDEKTYRIDSYILGVLIGDGSITNSTPAITSADCELINTVRSLLEQGTYINSSKSIQYYISDSSAKNNVENRYTKYLKELGLYGKYSHDKFIPESYKFGSVEQRYSLLQGILDTDGTVCRKTGAVSFSTASLRLAEDVIEVVRSLGGKANYSVKQAYFTYKGERKAGRLSYIVSINVEDKRKLFTLERKKALVSNTDITQLRRVLVSYEFLGEEECQCISVEAEDRLYLTDDFIVTHNTLATLHTFVSEYLNDQSKQIIFIRTPVEAGMDKIGALPDSLEAKIEPHFASAKKLMEQILSKNKVETDMGHRIHFKIPNFCLGATFDNALICIDEAQQLPPLILKLLLERTGINSKVVVLGDNTQLYTDARNRNALLDAIPRFFDVKNEHKPRYESVAYHSFDVNDVMRSDLVKTVITAYSK